MNITKEKLAKIIDHTKLKPYEHKQKIKKLCEEALNYNFAAVCVHSCWADLCSTILKGSDVKTCCVVGFPLGASATDIKVHETEYVIKRGAEEIDMVINIGAVKEKNFEFVFKDISAVVKSAKAYSKDIVVKVIIETGYLTDDEKVTVCRIARDAQADFVKTSTGFGPMGALPSDIRLMRATVGKDMGVKAAGGITDFRSAMRCIEAGANRLGTSSGINIIESFDWAKYSKAWFIEEIPCTICPSRAASLSQMPENIYLYYKAKCRTCEYKQYNIFYDE
jgi:deoxyribose-phosphate aldolase